MGLGGLGFCFGGFGFGAFGFGFAFGFGGLGLGLGFGGLGLGASLGGVFGLGLGLGGGFCLGGALGGALGEGLGLGGGFFGEVPGLGVGLRGDGPGLREALIVLPPPNTPNPPFVVFAVTFAVLTFSVDGLIVFGFGETLVTTIFIADVVPSRVVSLPAASVDTWFGSVVALTVVFTTVDGAFGYTSVTSELTCAGVPAIVVGTKTEDTVVTGPPKYLLVIDAKRPCFVTTVVQVDAG